MSEMSIDFRDFIDISHSLWCASAVRFGTTSDGRAVLLEHGRAFDVHESSGGRFGPGPMDVLERWASFRQWATQDASTRTSAPNQDLGAPSPWPRQVFCIGLNYRDHASEVGRAGEPPAVFTKFPSCLAGPVCELPLPGATVDFEGELVVVIGSAAEEVREQDAWAHVAGLTVGQDFSERTVQRRGNAPQYSLGKSFANFGPTGPTLVTTDEFDDPDDLELITTVNGEVVQRARTAQLIHSVPRLLAYLSVVCRLLPGDLIFTGTPGGVGAARRPPRYLAPGDEVVTRIAGIGEIRQRCVADGQRNETLLMNGVASWT